MFTVSPVPLTATASGHHVLLRPLTQNLSYERFVGSYIQSINMSITSFIRADFYTSHAGDVLPTQSSELFLKLVLI